MILTTHAITGAAIASTIPTHPVLGFTLGFCSHFLLDAIPHWEYNLASISEDKVNPINTDIKINSDFLHDLLKVIFDGFLGIGLSLLIFVYYSAEPSFPNLLIPILAGSIGGMLPDALQFVYWKCRIEPFISLQKFHIKIHAKTKLLDRVFLGTTSQILIIMIIVLLARYWNKFL